VELPQVVIAIFYKLKTGVQWRFLPVKQFIEKSLRGKGSIIISENGILTAV
jgi:transposase